MSNGSFFAALTCMDGRTQEPVARLLRDQFSVEFVDTITEPGIVRFLAADVQGEPSRDWLHAKANISVMKHRAQAVAVVAHADCAGNPVSDDEQRRQLTAAAKVIQSWYPSIPILSVWVAPNRTGRWQATVVEG